MTPPVEPDGIELWRGPSAIDGSPIGVVVTHLERAPLNRKIGNMAQAWILPLDTSPIDAVQSGVDAGVCGSCRFRPAAGGGCYVPLAVTAQRVWWAWRHNGSYTPQRWHPSLEGKPVRIGAWGDPLAVPLEVWLDLAFITGAWTAYTHRWRQVVEDREHWQALTMASCDSAEEADEARALGWRTFRARLATDPLRPGERVCPSAEEAPTHGRVTCRDCKLCDGVRGRPVPDVAIIVHGAQVARALSWMAA